MSDTPKEGMAKSPWKKSEVPVITPLFLSVSSKHKNALQSCTVKVILLNSFSISSKLSATSLKNESNMIYFIFLL